MAQFDLHEIAFPTLDDTQIAKLGDCTAATLSTYAAGDVLFHVGDRNFKFFVIRSGEIEILDPAGDRPTTIAVHGRGEFTGDVSHLNGTPAIFTAIALSDCEVYAISGELLKQVINQCPDLGDIILRAFMARRQLVRESGTFTGVRVIGSRYSPDTFRIRDFLAKNLVLFTWIDLEANPDVDQLLKHFGVTEADTPIVVCTEHMLRNPSNRVLADAAGIHKLLDAHRLRPGRRRRGSGWPRRRRLRRFRGTEHASFSSARRLAVRPAAACASRTTWDFRLGLTGSELAERAVLQANKFGAVLSIPAPVTGVTFNGGYSVIALDDGETVVAKCLLVATGADYRRLEVDGLRTLRRQRRVLRRDAERGAAVPGRRRRRRGRRQLRRVRRPSSSPDRRVGCTSSSAATTSTSRCRHTSRTRIEQTANIEVLTRHVGRANARQRAACRQSRSGTARPARPRTLTIAALFSFIGAVPRTEWLPKEIETDARGFVRTGPAVERVVRRRHAARAVSASRRVVAACSPPATCAPAPSSASPRPSARDRWRFSSCTNI